MRLGELLISKRLITTAELEQGLELQKDRGEKLGRILVDLGFIAQRDVLVALSEQLNLPLVTIDMCSYCECTYNSFARFSFFLKPAAELGSLSGGVRQSFFAPPRLNG